MEGPGSDRNKLQALFSPLLQAEAGSVALFRLRVSFVRSVSKTLAANPEMAANSDWLSDVLEVRESLMVVEDRHRTFVNTRES